MRFLLRLFGRQQKCRHDYWPTDVWVLEDGSVLAMETCELCPSWKLTPLERGDAA